MERDEAESLLFREARLLDEGRLDEWRAMLTDDVVYRVPHNNGGDSRSQVSIIFDEGDRLTGRIWRLQQNGLNHSQDPPSTTVRFVSNVETEPAAPDGTLAIHCTLLLAAFRAATQRRDAEARTFAARCLYRVRRVDDAWKIAYKQVSLLEMDGVLPPMNFII
jgi:benzoate/toluate 1,2-dioxygenase beta subunit